MLILRIVSFLLVIFIAFPVYCKEKPGDFWIKTVGGTVTKVNSSGNTLTIRTVDQRNLTFIVNHSSVIMHEMTPIKLMDLKRGDPVSIQYDTFSPNKLIATRIKG